MSASYDPIYALLSLAVLVLIFGAFYGSFCSKIVYRLSGHHIRGTTLFSASVCPACGKKLSLRDKIPILSYINLRGQCRKCKADIPKISLIFEVIGMLLPFFFLWYENFSLVSFIDYFIAMALISDFFIYRSIKQYPLTISIFLILLGGFLIAANKHLFMEALLGLALALGIAILINILFPKNKHRFENSILFCALGFIFNWIGLGILFLFFIVLIPLNGLVNLVTNLHISKGSLLMIAALINLLFIEYFQEIVQNIFTFLLN